MRIRNSRPPFPLPSLPGPISRSTRHSSRDEVHFDERFLVEETNRQIGCSFNQWRNSAYQVTGERSSGEFCQEKLKNVISREIEPSNYEDEKNRNSNCMLEKLSQAFGEQHEARADDANGCRQPYMSTYNQYVINDRDGNTSSTAVNFGIVPPFTSSEPEKLPYKKRKQTYQPGMDMTRGSKEDTIQEKEIEPRKIPDLEDVEDKNSIMRPRIVVCALECPYFVPPHNGGFGHKMTRVSLDDTAAEHREKPRRRRKRKEIDQSGNSSWCNGAFIGKQGRTLKNGDHAANLNDGSMEMKIRKTGRPKVTKRRGRPRKANDLSISGNIKVEEDKHFKGEGQGRFN